MQYGAATDTSDAVVLHHQVQQLMRSRRLQSAALVILDAQELHLITTAALDALLHLMGCCSKRVRRARCEPSGRAQRKDAGTGEGTRLRARTSR